MAKNPTEYYQKNKQRITDRQNKYRQKNRQKKISSIYEQVKELNLKETITFLFKYKINIRQSLYNSFDFPFVDVIEEGIKKQREKNTKKTKRKQMKRYKKEHRVKLAIYNKVFRNKNKLFVNNYLSQHKCPCGVSKISALCFHHKDSSKKEAKVSRLISFSQDTILKEILKCEVLCQNCHSEIHVESKDRLSNLLKCYENIPKNKRSSKRARILLYLYKETCSCFNCNYDNSASLCFHHIDSTIKKKEISRLGSVPSINKELVKTICLCRNCHQDFHNQYGLKTTKSQLETFLGEKVIPIKVDINDYLPILDQKLSKFYNLPFLIT